MKIESNKKEDNVEQEASLLRVVRKEQDARWQYEKIQREISKLSLLMTTAIILLVLIAAAVCRPYGLEPSSAMEEKGEVLPLSANGRASETLEEGTEEKGEVLPFSANDRASETLDSLQKAQVCRNAYGDGGAKSKPYGFAPNRNGIYRLRVALGPEFGMEPCGCESPYTCQQMGGWMSSINKDVCDRSVALFNNATGASYECFPMCNSPQRFFFGARDRSCSGCYEAAKGADFSKVGLVPDTSNAPAHQCY